MQLTSEDGILPGIYRINLGNHVYGVPGIREPENEDWKISNLLAELFVEDEPFDPDFKLPEKDPGRGHWPKRTYFSGIEDFLDTWKRGYESERSQFGTNKYSNKHGFELFYVNWHPDTPFFKIGDHEGIHYMGGERADLRLPIILGDNNGMNDQYGYLNLGVNDFRTQKVLVFRERRFGYEDELHLRDKRFKPKNRNQTQKFRKSALTREIPKPLRDDLHYYCWSGEDRFPFISPNNLKSLHNMWTAVGIDPSEIYKAVEDLGFVFPEQA